MAVVEFFYKFAPESLEEGPVRIYDGLKFVPLKHHGLPILLQTGPLRTVKGVSKDEKIGKHTMSLVVNPESAEFQKLRAFDARVLELAAASTWLQTKCPDKDDAVIRELYTPALRVPDTGKRPTFRVTVPEKDVEVWDSDKQKITATKFLLSGMSIPAPLTVILRCTGIWIRGSKFGTSWKAMQIMVHPFESKIMKFLTPSPSRKGDTPSPPSQHDEDSGPWWAADDR